MASRRILKKDINYILWDIVDECLWIQDLDASKTDASEGVINEAIEFQNTILAEINRAKTKKDFAPIQAKIKAANAEFVQKLNALN